MLYVSLSMFLIWLEEQRLLISIDGQLIIRFKNRQKLSNLQQITKYTFSRRITVYD